ncbi:hypothetical protein Trydic_g11442 [Trypoxylus dichotomus]
MFINCVCHNSVKSGWQAGGPLGRSSSETAKAKAAWLAAGWEQQERTVPLPMVRGANANWRGSRGPREDERHPPLFDSYELVLTKGLNYALPLNSIPKEGITPEVEFSIWALPSVIVDQIRFETAKCFISGKPLRSNLTDVETEALRNLQSHSDSIILQADKGNAILTDLLVSFDVTSLYTKLSIPASLSIIEQLLERDKKSPDLAT